MLIVGTVQHWSNESVYVLDSNGERIVIYIPFLPWDSVQFCRQMFLGRRIVFDKSATTVQVCGDPLTYTITIGGLELRKRRLQFHCSR